MKLSIFLQMLVLSFLETIQNSPVAADRFAGKPWTRARTFTFEKMADFELFASKIDLHTSKREDLEEKQYQGSFFHKMCGLMLTVT